MVLATSITKPTETITQLPPPPCPYKGLFAFEEVDAPFFFGREKVVHQLYKAVHERSMVSVVGPSGSGKSSVVYAGLIPGLRAEGQNPAAPLEERVNWQVISFRPGDRPFQSVVVALLPFLEDQASVLLGETVLTQRVQVLTEALMMGKIHLPQLIQQIQERYGDNLRLLVVVNQFEELFTLCPSERERVKFLEELLRLGQVRSNELEEVSFFAPPTPTPAPVPALLHTCVMLTLRADFMGHALSYRILADALEQSQFNLGPLTRSEMAMAVEGPASKQGIILEEGLTGRILSAVNERPGDLPLLEFAMMLLWGRQSQRKLTLKAYEEMGGVEMALARYAEQVYSRLYEYTRPLVQQLMVQLIRPGEGVADTRRVASWAEIGEANWPLVTYLADQRLVVTNLKRASGEETVEIVHEALISSWQRLRDWMDASRQLRSWQERLRPQIQQWEKSGRDNSGLLRGMPLDEALGWVNNHEQNISRVELGFIQAGLAFRKQEEAEKQEREQREKEGAIRQAELERQRAETAEALVKSERRGRKRQQIFMVGISVLLVMALGLAFLAVVQQQAAVSQQKEALQQRTLATSRQLAAQSRVLVDSNFERATSLALAGYRLDPNWEVRESLNDALLAHPEFITFLNTDKKRVWGVAYSPDGKILASDGGSDGGSDSIILWDTASRSRIAMLKGADAIFAFSPDGKILASGGSDGAGGNAIILWDVASRAQLATVTGLSSSVFTLAFSPDGKTLASGGSDGKLVLWEVASRTQLAILEGPKQTVWSVAFSPDGKTLASGDTDGNLFLWDTSSRSLLTTLQKSTSAISSTAVSSTKDAITSVAFSPDSKTLASGGTQGSLFLWDVKSYKQLATFDTRANDVWSVVFSPDGKSIAVGCTNNSIILWDVATRTRLTTLQNGLFNPSLLKLAFSPDGKTLVSGSSSNRITLWDLTGSNRTRLATLRDDYSSIRNVTISPDGKTLASGTSDEKVILWDRASRSKLATLDGYKQNFNNIVFSSDSKTIAFSGSENNKNVIKLWDVISHTQLATLDDHSNSEVSSLAFSPDGKTLASSDSKKVIVWDYTNHQQIAVIKTTSARSTVFSPDGKLLAISNGNADNKAGNNIILWDVASRSQVATLSTPSTNGSSNAALLRSVVFSPDGKMLACVSYDQETTILWDVASRSQITTLKGIATSLEFSPDSKTLAIGNTYNDTYGIVLWDIASRVPRAILKGHLGAVTSINYTPDGKSIISAGLEGNIIYWDASADTRPERACLILNENLKPEDWKKAAGDEPYQEICPGLS